MTKRRQQSILDRYHRHADAWSELSGPAGRIEQTTYGHLAELSGLHPGSVGRTLARMQALGIISDLTSHQADGTAFTMVAPGEEVLP